MWPPCRHAWGSTDWAPFVPAHQAPRAERWAHCVPVRLHTSPWCGRGACPSIRAQRAKEALRSALDSSCGPWRMTLAYSFEQPACTRCYPQPRSKQSEPTPAAAALEARPAAAGLQQARVASRSRARGKALRQPAKQTDASSGMHRWISRWSRLRLGGHMLQALHMLLPQCQRGNV